MTTYVHYLVEGADTHAKIAEWIEQTRLTNAVLSEFMTKYGDGSGRYMSSWNKVHAIRCNTKPEGWVEEGHKYYRPHALKKVCREAHEEFKALPKTPNADDLAKHLDLSPRVEVPNGNLASIGMENVGEHRVLLIPVNKDGTHEVPEGCRELKVSEFYALKGE